MLPEASQKRCQKKHKNEDTQNEQKSDLGAKLTQNGSPKRTEPNYVLSFFWLPTSKIISGDLAEASRPAKLSTRTKNIRIFTDSFLISFTFHIFLSATAGKKTRISRKWLAACAELDRPRGPTLPRPPWPKTGLG